MRLTHDEFIAWKLKIKAIKARQDAEHRAFVQSLTRDEYKTLADFQENCLNMDSRRAFGLGGPNCGDDGYRFFADKLPPGSSIYHRDDYDVIITPIPVSLRPGHKAPQCHQFLQVQRMYRRVGKAAFSAPVAPLELAFTPEFTFTLGPARFEVFDEAAGIDWTAVDRIADVMRNCRSGVIGLPAIPGLFSPTE